MLNGTNFTTYHKLIFLYEYHFIILLRIFGVRRMKMQFDIKSNLIAGNYYCSICIIVCEYSIMHCTVSRLLSRLIPPFLTGKIDDLQERDRAGMQAMRL